MNCGNFNEVLEEYLEETLPPGERALAAAHVAACLACAETLRRREQAGTRLREVFRLAAQPLSLRAEMECNIEREWRHKTPRVAPAQAPWFAQALFWRWAAVAAVVSVVLVAGHLLSRPGKAGVGAGGNVAFVEVSYRIPVQTFQWDGEFVRDRVSYATVSVSTRLGAASAANQSSKP